MRVLLYCPNAKIAHVFVQAMATLALPDIAASPPRNGGAHATGSDGLGRKSGIVWGIYQSTDSFLNAIAQADVPDFVTCFLVMDLEALPVEEALGLVAAASSLDDFAEFAIAGAAPGLERRIRAEFDDIHFTFLLNAYEPSEWRRAIGKMSVRSRLRRDLFHASHLATPFSDGGAVHAALNAEKASEQVYQASHDSLTGLANRRTFSERLREAAGMQRPTAAVILIDLDHFKPVNDTMGHQAGDELLRQVATRLAQSLDDLDLAARLGGDEFAVLLKDAKTAEIKSERILSALKEPFVIFGARVQIGASLGVADVRSDLSISEVLRRADEALYVAKRAGRGCAQTFDDTMTAQMKARENFVEALRSAILADAPAPILMRSVCSMSAPDGAIAQIDPSWDVLGGRDIADPYRVIEEAGLGPAVGVWLLNAVRDAVSATNTPILVPLNMGQLRSHPVCEAVDRLLRGAVDPARIALGVPELVLALDRETTRVRLSRWRKLGARICIDALGDGPGDLVALSQIKPDILRLSDRLWRTITDEAEPNNLAAMLVKALVQQGVQVVTPKDATPQTIARAAA